MAFDERRVVQKFLETREEKEFRQLYKRHTLPLYRLALGLTGYDQTGAQDIIQEMWLRAILQLPEFRWQSALKTWLSGIVINCCREYHRKQKMSDVNVDQFENVLRGSDEKIENKIDIHNALSALPHGYREVLVLHDLEGYKHAEIAELLGINTGTSKSQLFNARQTIKKFLT